MGMSDVQILEELKQRDYELFTRIGKSHLSENQWDWLIDNFAEMKLKEKKNDKKRN